ncbi:helicase associated domain-containing protein [Mycobacteroides chelonae]|uniref:helicase associated domain-containing protein n=1 Tax=Mycobacteroides chelonae TaxID=1774 RepID=UPI0013F4F923|nr:helicase associated domain-containing protein [Mycobacteroides chelonae]
MSDEKTTTPDRPEYPLGEWAAEQRRRHENHELSPSRIAELKELSTTADTDADHPQ